MILKLLTYFFKIRCKLLNSIKSAFNYNTNKYKNAIKIYHLFNKITNIIHQQNIHINNLIKIKSIIININN